MWEVMQYFPGNMHNDMNELLQGVEEWYQIQWNPSIKATQDGGLSKEVACHEG